MNPSLGFSQGERVIVIPGSASELNRGYVHRLWMTPLHSTDHWALE